MPSEHRPGDFNLEERCDDGVVVLRVEGEMDLATSPGVAVRVRDAIERGERRFCIDLNGVEFIDSTGIAALVHCHEAVTRVDGSLQLDCSNDGEVMKLLELTGVDRLFSGKIDG